MNKLLLPLIAASLGALTHLQAQGTPPPAGAAAAVAPKATPPPADPFVRDARPVRIAEAAVVPAAAAAESRGNPEPAVDVPDIPYNLLTSIETWTLSQADYVTLLEGSADQRGPYDHLEALAKTDKAKLTGLIAICTKSGNRAIVEAIDELRYPTEFAGEIRPGEGALPTSYETRNVGDTLEIDPLLGPDGKLIDLNLLPQTVRFLGFRDWQPLPQGPLFAQPIFHTQKVTTSTTVSSGRPVLLDAVTIEGGEGGKKQVRLRALRATAQRLPARVAPALDPALTMLRAELLVYSLGREDARRVLNDTPDTAQGFAAVRALEAKGAAQLEAVTAFLIKSGARSTSEEIDEYRYFTALEAPAVPEVQEANEGSEESEEMEEKEEESAASEGGNPCSSSPKAGPSRALAYHPVFETRNTGSTIEIEAVADAKFDLVDVNIVPQIVQMSGLLKAVGAAAKYPAQPVFTTRKVTTAVSARHGVPQLLGTMSLPGATGVNERKDDGRTSLVYIRVTPIRP